MCNHFGIHRPILFALCSILFLSASLLKAQESSPPVNKWLSILSTKKGNDMTYVDTVFNALRKLNPNDICPTLAILDDRASQRNEVLKIRLTLLRARLHLNLIGCSTADEIENRLMKALHTAYKLENQLLIANVCRTLAAFYIMKEDFGNIILYNRIANEILEKMDQKKLLNNYEHYNYGFALYHAQDYRDAVNENKAALGWTGTSMEPSNSTLSTEYTIQALNTTGLAYHKMQMYDSAFYCYNQAIAIFPSGFWGGLVKGNIGDIYYELGNFDTAFVLLKYDVEQSRIVNEVDNAANSMQWLARILTKRGKADDAIDTLRVALKYLSQQPNDNFLANTLYAFAEAFQKKGNADSVSHYMREYQTIHDRIERRHMDHRIELVQIRLNYNDAAQKILALNKDKKRISLIRYLSIVLILFASTIGYIYLNRQRVKLQLKQKEALLASQRAEAEAKHARQQLTLFTENLREKTQLVEDLQTQLLNKELNAEQTGHLQELSKHSILTDEDWDHFKNLFNKVYPNFFIDLKRDVPDITTAELRIAALIKLQLPVKDAANMLGISPNSVHKNRQRLRTRLGIPDDDKLEEYIVNREP